MITHESLQELIDKQTSNTSLTQRFYTDSSIYRHDLQSVIFNQWLLVDHESRIANPGEYFLFDIDDESIILIRGDDEEVYAHFNVCALRGSRICLEEEGTRRHLVCPYHAWSYEKNGQLSSVKFMPESFDCSKISLKPCHVKVHQGLIFLCLSQGSPPDFETFIEGMTAFLELHSTTSAKIAFRHNFDTKANWKLVVENFIECYHCFPAHPELCAVRDRHMIIGAGAGPSSGDASSPEFAASMQRFEEKAAGLDQLPPEVDDYEGAQQFRSAHRAPLRDGCLSESDDGRPIAPLSHGFHDRDGGYTGITFNPLSHMLATNDAAFLFSFTPISPERTNAQIIWLINNDAEEGEDYDIDRLTWAWKITGSQDLIITENNYLGVKSRAYEPHVHSLMETNVTAFCSWYLKNLEASIAGNA